MLKTDPEPSPVVTIGPTRFGNDLPLALIAGPCALESRAHALEMASALKEIASRLGIGLVYKTSFDKANRTSARSARGIGLDAALPIFAEIKSSLGVPVLTDVHEAEQCARVAQAVDVLQIPAFLCRQTDLLAAAAATGRVVNVKKGQFLAPDDMGRVVEKIRAAGGDRVLLCERGTSFGYHNLVVDMRAFPMLRAFGCPIVYDVTHSMQLPGGGRETGGLRQYAPALARAAAATGGVDGFFLEVHDDPDHALSDHSTQLDVATLPNLIRSILSIVAAVKNVQS
jgi:2-dehydro-3-deoxyphosphooctonate aldolase (KDO 8-P synthase)